MPLIGDLVKIDFIGPGPCTNLVKTQEDNYLMFVSYTLTKIGKYEIKIEINGNVEYRKEDLYVYAGNIHIPSTHIINPYPILKNTEVAVIKV